MPIWESLFIWEESRESMKGYSRAKEDFLELLYLKYRPMEENEIWCLWLGEQPTDYQLCNGDSDLLPTLVRKDEIRYEYNQYKNKWSYVSCTIFAAVGMISDLFNYKFSYDEIKEIDELSYERWRIRWQWWYVQSAVKLVADWWNEKMERKVTYYRISKSNDSIMEDSLDKLYTLDWNLCLTEEYNRDKLDWMIDGTEFWNKTSWHSVCIVKKEWQRSVKDSGSVSYYWLKNKLSKITNFWQYFYIYVPVNDNLEEIKRLNEFKSALLVAIEQNSKLRHLTNDTNYQSILHYTNEKNRKKVEDIDNELKKYV